MPSYFNHFRQHLTIALPVAVSQIGHIMVGVADTVIAGQLGSTPLASATIASSLFIPFLMFGIGLSYGTTSLVAQADGANAKELVKDYFHQSLTLNLGIGIVLFILLVVASFYLQALGQPNEVTNAAIPFVQLLAISIIPLMVFQTFKQFAEGLSDTKMAMVISLLANVINVGLSLTLIKGWLGIKPMGLIGIAYATLIARILMALAMGLYIFYNHNYNFYREHLFTIIYRKKIASKIINIGFPVGFQMVLESGSFGIAAIMIGWIGTSEIAAHQIALCMAATTYMAASGFGASATVKVGNEWGRNNPVELKKAAISAWALVVLFMTFTGLIFILFKTSLPTFFINDPDVLNIATKLLLITAIFQWADGIQVVGFGILRGMGDVLIPSVFVFIGYYLMGLPLGYWLAFQFGLGIYGIWFGLTFGLFFLAIFLFLRFFKLHNTK